MDSDPVPLRSWSVTMIVIGLWLFPCVATTVLFQAFGGIGLVDAAKTALKVWGIWTILAPLVVWLSFRCPLQPPQLVRRLMIHLAVCFLIVVANQWVARHYGIVAESIRTAGPPSWILGANREGRGIEATTTSSFSGRRGAPPLARVVLDTLIYGLLVIGCQTVAWARLARARELRALKAEAGLATARLEALQLQLNPHFLFNSLNGVTALIRLNPQGAEKLIESLSELLRAALNLTNQQEIPLWRELECLGHYVAIEQMRFEERFRYSQSIAEETLNSKVPTFILQPLIENAIRHGTEQTRSGGEVRLETQRRPAGIRIRVSNTGPGFSSGSDPKNGHGIGLANTRSRLEQLYPGSHELSLREGEAGGCIVTIDLPFRPEHEGSSTLSDD